MTFVIVVVFINIQLIIDESYHRAFPIDCKLNREIAFGEEEAGLSASRAFVCLFLYVLVFVIFSSSWCRGLAAVCDCGTPCTFLLTFLQEVGKK